MDIDVEAMLDAPFQEKRVNITCRVCFKAFHLYKMKCCFLKQEIQGKKFNSNSLFSFVFDRKNILEKKNTGKLIIYFLFLFIFSVFTHLYLFIALPDTTLHTVPTLVTAPIPAIVPLTIDHILDIAAEDIVVLPAVKEDIDVLLPVITTDAAEVDATAEVPEDAAEALEDAAEVLMIGIVIEEEEVELIVEDMVDPLHHPFPKKIEIEERCLSLNSQRV